MRLGGNQMAKHSMLRAYSFMVFAVGWYYCICNGRIIKKIEDN